MRYKLKICLFLLILILYVISSSVYAQTLQHTYINSNDSTSSLVVTISNSTTGDNLIAVDADDATLTGVSGNCLSWTLILQTTAVAITSIYCGSSCTGTTSVTFSYAGSGYAIGTVYDVSGLISCTPDITSSDSGTSGTAIDAGTSTTTNSGDFGVCSLNAIGTSILWTGVPLDSAAYGLWKNGQLTSPQSNVETQHVSQKIIATNSHTCSVTANNPSTSWSGVQAWFKGPPIPYFMP